MSREVIWESKPHYIVEVGQKEYSLHSPPTIMWDAVSFFPYKTEKDGDGKELAIADALKGSRHNELVRVVEIT